MKTIKKMLMAAVAACGLSASADPLPPELWKTEYPKQLQAVQKKTSGFRMDADQYLSEPLRFVTSHWGEWEIQPEYDKIVELALPKLEFAGNLKMGRPAARLLYDSPTASPAARLQAARYLALGLIDSRRDYDGAEALIWPIQDLCRTNGNLRVLADAVALRAHLWVLREKRQEALDVIESARSLRVGEKNREQLNQLLNTKHADVLLAFNDTRAALDWYVKCGYKVAAYKLIRSGKVSDPKLLHALAKDVAAGETENYEGWGWLWEHDEKAAWETLPNVLGRHASVTNRFIGVLGGILGDCGWPPWRPAPAVKRQWTLTARTWELYADLLAKTGGHPAPKAAQYAVLAYTELGERAKAVAAADAALGNPKIKPEETYGLEMMKCVLALAGDESHVMEAIAKADAELGKDCPADKRADRFERAASLALVLADEGVQRGVAKYYKTHYNPQQPKRVYDVGFASVPLTGVADFDRLGRQTPASAFTRAYGGATDFLETDVTSGSRSVGGEGSEGSVSLRVVADAWGLHILQTLVTEKARAIEAGEANGGSYECYLASPDAPHRIFMCYPSKAKPAAVMDLNYDRPGFRKADEKDPNTFRSAVRFTDTAVENYVGFSWGLFTDVLPADGAVWDFESLYWGAKSCAWNGTESIHGRSTFGQFRFRLDDAARRAIARERLYAAVRVYKDEKGPHASMGSPLRSGILDFWQDPVTGDPAFYATCVKPIVDTLDPVAAHVKSTMTDADVDELAAYLPRFHNLRFEIAQLREKYLTDDLLPDVSPSEAYLAEARKLYRLPAYQALTNSIVERYRPPKGVRGDWPAPGDRIGWVKVEGMHNFRDIGGWNGLKTGRIYRGGEPDTLGGSDPGNGPTSHFMVEWEGVKTLREKLGIRTDLDLRKKWECPDPDRSALGITLVRAPVRAYGEMFDKVNRRAWADAIRLFTDKRNYPVYFHCWGGADRTGALAMILQALCDVDEADCHIEYELTTFGGALRARNANYYADMIKRIRKYCPNGTFREQVAAMIKKEYGITDAEIAAIRANLMEDDPKTPVPTVLAEFRKSAEHPRNSEGDVIELKNGNLLVVYTHFYKDAASRFADGGHDSSSAELVLTESADGGKTWSPMRTIVRKEKGTLNVMSASFLRLGDGRLSIFYLAKNTEKECLPTMIVSSDEGKTWSKPACCLSVADKGYYVLNNARAYRLTKTGRILLPLACHYIGGKSYPNGAVLSCAISDDDGKTWRMSADRRMGPAATNGVAQVCLQEPGLIELKDGRLMMYARSNERRQWRLYSTDGGDHWTPPEPVTEYSTTTYSPVTYARLKDGRLVVVYNDAVGHSEKPVAYERRWPLSVGVSSDEGKTWKTKLLEPDDPTVGAVHACYIALREIAGRLVLVYCYTDALATTRVASVPLDWLP